MEWYEAAQARLQTIADTHGTSLETVAGVTAALSQRRQWSINIRDAESLIAGKPVGGLRLSVERATRIRNGESPWRVLRGPKVRAFYRALLGDRQAVVLDVWMARALGHKRDSFKPAEYRRFAARLRRAAKRAGMAPRDYQARVWLATKEGQA